MEERRISTREMFWNLLEMELQRGLRYQNHFCLLTFNLCRIDDQANGKGLQICYQDLSQCLIEELRETDVLGFLGEDQLGVILPYADPSAGGLVRSRIEARLKCDEFNDQGYEVMIHQTCFPRDGMDMTDLSIRRTPFLYN